MRRYSHLLIAILLTVSVLAVIPSSAQGGAPAWQPNTAYAVGALVTYNGSTYQCRQAHTSQVGWEPPNVPALWLLVTSGNPTNTNTPTKTNTTRPGSTNTNTPTSTVTQGGGGGCSVPAWSSTAVYVGGNQVSFNGHLWQAKWWTQGDVPGGSANVWADLGLCSGGPTNTPTQQVTFQPPTNTPVSTVVGHGGGRIMGYFVEWGVYGRNYHVKNIDTSGSAAKLTHINYAFGNVTNGQCAIGDSFADYDKFYDAASSVSGVSDTWDAGALRGSFHQLQELKAKYPGLKVIYSFGGWTWSGGFGAAAANAAAFADSCFNLLHDARWNGVFDGIDIDWEYPNACGLSCDTSGFGAYKTLMAALRSRFGSSFLITAAITADATSGGHIDAADYGGASQYVDWYNVMSYDFFGAWAATGPTAPHSPLYSYPGIPTAKFDADDAIQKLKGKGIPANKLMLGIGFYGRGWTGVTQSTPGGSATGAAAGTYEAGIEDYKVLVSSCPSTGTVAGTAYAFCGNNWWSYDTPSTIAGKMGYEKSQGLGGAFVWEFSGDTSNGSLISAIYNNR